METVVAVSEAQSAPDLYDMLEIGDLRGEWRDVAEVMGIEAVRSLLRHFRGAELYVPVKVPQDTMKRYARAMLRHGRTMTEVACALGIKRRTLQSLVLKSGRASAEDFASSYPLFLSCDGSEQRG